MEMPGERVRAALFGATGDNSNLGVAALMHATLQGLGERLDAPELWVFDNGWGVRSSQLATGDGALSYIRCGARLSRRYHRPESYTNMALSTRMRGWRNPGVQALYAAAAILDISGGDSFTDLYGEKRFRTVLTPKRLAVRLRRPLVLLPQTFGPFATRAAADAATGVLRAASAVWARDQVSLETVHDLVGDQCDGGDRIRLGVDVAFGLEVHAPSARLPPTLMLWLFEGRDRPVVGVNVSGLLYNDPDYFARHAIAADYRSVIDGVIERLLRQTDARIVIVDHVLTPPGKPESDRAAGEAVIDRLSLGDRRRVIHAPQARSASEVKWLISQLDWFCGARMHATIAALSACVPVAAIGYSPKTTGVFATCDMQPLVADAAAGDAETVIEHVWGTWERRDEIREALAVRIPAVVDEARAQMDDIAAQVVGGLAVGPG